MIRNRDFFWKSLNQTNKATVDDYSNLRITEAYEA